MTRLASLTCALLLLSTFAESPPPAHAIPKLAQVIKGIGERGGLVLAQDAFGDSAQRLVYLDQGWGPPETLWFYHADQGSGLLPYKTLIHLEQADSEQLLTQPENLARFRFLNQHKTPNNPDALPIGFAQTISQPYIVARMTEDLRNGKQLGKILEIGTGCGYQTAVLSRVAKEVLSLERIRPLVMKARGHLRTLKCNNVKLDHADGSLGLNQFAPFDGIIVTAAASHVPQELLAQLVVGGRMVIPIGTNEQTLYLIERTNINSEADYKHTKLEPVKFVPLLGGTSA